MDGFSKEDLIKEIVADVELEINDEEIIRIILERKVSEKETPEKYTFGQKSADAVAKLAGSWGFIIIFITALTIWIIINANMGTSAFDPYPFILLNLGLSCIAAIQAPLILMSQNRQEKKDRQRAENDYRVNLKTEIIIRELYEKLDAIATNLSSPPPVDVAPYYRSNGGEEHEHRPQNLQGKGGAKFQ